MRPVSRNMSKSLASQRPDYSSHARAERQRPSGSISMPPGEGTVQPPPGAASNVLGRRDCGYEPAEARVLGEHFGQKG
jgi:hypothetical protein